ncbi:MAG TPA: hypothetical protein VNU93_00375 [Verrucomicrobiae bacterium]|nr:hypothetical protein [Verrucomicrobiae bacterium]
MEILHVARHIDQCEQVNVCVEDIRSGVVSAAEIISTLGSADYHRNLSWL